MLLKEVGLISNASWNPGPAEPIKGYSLDVNVDGVAFKQVECGNKTRSSKGSFQELTKEGRLFRIEFYTYY